jgi:hypothetical protein
LAIIAILPAMSERKQLDPARTVIAKLGGAETVARITGKHVSRVYRWMKPKKIGGTGGTIPQADAVKLLHYAKAENIDLRAEHFFGEVAA